MKLLKRLYARWLSLALPTIQKRIELAGRAISMLEAAGRDPNEWKFHRSKLRQRYYRIKDKVDRLNGRTA